jgi:hypothetical protein
MAVPQTCGAGASRSRRQTWACCEHGNQAPHARSSRARGIGACTSLVCVAAPTLTLRCGDDIAASALVAAALAAAPGLVREAVTLGAPWTGCRSLLPCHESTLTGYHPRLIWGEPALNHTSSLFVLSHSFELHQHAHHAATTPSCLRTGHALHHSTRCHSTPRSPPTPPTQPTRPSLPHGRPRPTQTAAGSTL